MGAVVTTKTPQTIVLSTGHSARELIAFYRAVCARRGWEPVSSIPNGLQIGDPESPISYVTLSKAQGGLYLVLQRNVLVETPEETAAMEQASAWGAVIKPGAVEVVRTQGAVTYEIDEPIEQVVDYYQDLYGRTDGIQSQRARSAIGLTLTIIATGADAGFGFLTVAPNTSNPDRPTVWIVVTAKP